MSNLQLMTDVSRSAVTVSGNVLLQVYVSSSWEVSNRVIVWLLALIAVLATVVLVRAHRASQPRSLTKSFYNIPRAFSLPLIGSPWLLLGLPHLVVTELSRRYGHMFRMHAGGDRHFVILNNIDLVKEAMRRFPSALAGKPQSTTTRMTNAGAQQDMGRRWGRRRHITMSACRSLLREAPADVNNVCDEELRWLVTSLTKTYSAEGYEPTHDITYFVARFMWRVIYGQCQQPDDNTCQLLHQLTTKIDDYTQNSGPFSQLDRFPLLKRLVKGSMARYQDAVRFMDRMFEDEDARRRQTSDDDGHQDIMTHMMRRAGGLTEEDERTLGLTPHVLFQGVGDLIRAGTESPSLLLLWACLMLAQNQRAQDRMAAELEGCRDDVIVCQTSPEELPYTHAVVYETIRCCSVVPFLKRRALDDVIVGGHRLPRGTNIIINNHAISHDPAHWPDPHTFRPERFLRADDSFDSTALERFLPFGVGKRRCMGEELGKLLPFAAIATLVMNFHISAPPGQALTTEPSFGITLTPQKHRYVFRPRATPAS